MDARNNLKIIHTVDGAILQNRYGKAVIRSHDIGLISLPTGEIVMADPTLRFEIADFKPGRHFSKRSLPAYILYSHIPLMQERTAHLRLQRSVSQISHPLPSRQPRPYVTPSSPAAGTVAMLLMSQRRD